MRLENEHQLSATKSRRLDKIINKIVDNIYDMDNSHNYHDLNDILEVICDAIEAEVASLWVYNKYTTNKINILASYGGSSEISNVSIDPGQGISGKVIVNNQAVIIDDCQKDVRWEKKADDKTGFVTRSMICVPLSFENTVFGCLQIINAEYGVFDDIDSDFISDISNALSEMMSRKKYIIGYLSKDNERRYLITHKKEQIRFIAAVYAEISNFNDEIIPAIGIRKAVILINRFYAYASNITVNNGGYIDEYQGQKILLTWNTTEEFDNAGALAAKAAFQMKEQLNQFNNEMKKELGVKIQLKLGVNYGPAFVGVFGHVENYDYTAIGSTVDLVSRLVSDYGKNNEIICTSSLLKDMNLPSIYTYLDTVEISENKKQEIFVLSKVDFQD